MSVSSWRVQVKQKGEIEVEGSQSSTNGYELEHVKLAMCWPWAARFIWGTVFDVEWNAGRLFGVREDLQIEAA
ncbi:unnamed protein product [Fusarium venenatum]|uniref:Uncharacterized protein n=1 Tax=Fusarium venenatum TaxID=56646 RepID=A0A2L2U314_9HYPO|nr:uncharacterized protein FVRRES_09052 [Fusarium venenatum]CEI68975.1 unnamed protein product [Fusarium venenatum]